MRGSDNVRLATQDDRDLHMADSLTQHGFSEQGTALANAVYERQRVRQTIYAAQQEQGRKELLQRIADDPTASTLEDVYNQHIPTSMHVKIGQNASGQWVPAVYDNDTGKHMFDEPGYASLEGLRAHAAAFMADPGTYQTTLDRAKEISGAFAANMATARKSNAEVDAGVPAAESARSSAVAAASIADAGEADARTRALKQASDVEDDLKATNLAASTETDPVKKAALLARSAALQGQIAPKYSSIPGPNGVPIAITTYGNGTVTTNDPTVGEVPYGQEAATKQALADAKARGIVLTHGMHNVPGLGPTHLFNVGGDPRTNDPTAPGALKKYEDLKPKQAIPADAPTQTYGAIPGYSSH